MRFFKYVPLLLLPLITAQMPGWKTYTDTDGNTFFFDVNGKIHLEGKPTFDYKAVAAEGLPFYLEQARSLMENRYRNESITILKSVVYLADLDPSLHNYGVQAAQEMNRIIRRQGSRYPFIDLETSLIFARTGSTYHLADPVCGLEMTTDALITILKKSSVWKSSVKRDSFMIGLNFNGKFDGTYDAIISFVAEKTPYNWNDVSTYREFAQKKTGEDIFRRTTEQSSAKELVFSFDDNGQRGYRGREIYRINGKWGYFIRAFHAGKNETEIKVKNFFQSIEFKGSDI